MIEIEVDNRSGVEVDEHAACEHAPRKITDRHVVDALTRTVVELDLDHALRSA